MALSVQCRKVLLTPTNKPRLHDTTCCQTRVNVCIHYTTGCPTRFDNRLNEQLVLGTDLCLGPGDIVLDGNPVLPYKGHSIPPPIFGRCLFWPSNRPSQLLLSSCHITSSPLPSNRHHRSNGECLEGKRGNYLVCSVQYGAQQLCTVQCTHMNRLTVLWIAFYLTGPISLCLDSFLYCVLLCVVCMRRFVTR